MFRVHGRYSQTHRPDVIQVLEVENRSTSLLSTDSFIVINRQHVFIWNGKFSSPVLSSCDYDCPVEQYPHRLPLARHGIFGIKFTRSDFHLSTTTPARNDLNLSSKTVQLYLHDP